MTATKTGDLNGAWAWLLRLGLATYPLVLAWMAWATVSIVRLEPGHARYTHQDARADHSEMQADIQQKLYALPPPDWRRKIDAIETAQRLALERMNELDKQLSVILERLPE